MKRFHPADLASLSARIEEEQMLLDAGIAWLRRTGSDEDIDLWPPEVLISLGRKSNAPLQFDDPAFLQCANIRRRHLAIHHYPQGEERRAFRYRPI